VIFRKFKNTWFCSVLINGVIKQRLFDFEKEAINFVAENTEQIKRDQLPDNIREYNYVLKKKGVNYYYKCLKASFKINGVTKHCLRTYGNNGKFANRRTREQAKEIVMDWLKAAKEKNNQ